MAKISLAGFKDPVRRPRYVIWTGIVVLALAAFIVIAFGATSTYWFCANVCHKVQDDSIAAYNRSSHSMVSCMSCHEPVNANPVLFTLYKAKALGELVLTVTNNFELPLNPDSHLAMDAKHMGSRQCTQCHNLKTRKVTPSPGIKIDHDAHEAKDIHCTACHNRVAHNESGDWEPTLTDPKTKKKSVKHQNFMTMTACFRCHTLTSEPPAGGIKAPGKCSACHPADFDLKPPSHKEKGFYPKGHAKLATAKIDRSTGKPVLSEEGSEAEEAAEEAAEHEEEKAAEGEGLHLVAVDKVDYCATCHIEATFCMGCHGMEMPHPAEFKEKTHPQVAKTKMDKCDMCHQVKKTNYQFCNECHHGTKVNWKYDPKVAWRTQHAKAVSTNGVSTCFGACHDQKFCVECHTKLKPLPASHKDAKWLRDKLTVTKYGSAAAQPSGKHALAALKAIDSCDVCHGPGGTNAKFCKGCHGMEMPHPDAFKKNHVSGRKTPQLCANCHTFKEVCSDCHHVDAVNGVPWQKQHPKAVAAKGTAPCFEKCHENKQFCVDCHTKLKALPASHKASDWTRNLALGKSAKHSASYKAQPDSCEYCHGTGGTESKFCKNCHKLPMPHPANFKDTHKADFQAKKLTKPVCTNCHDQYFCDNCHHKGAVTNQRWYTYHPNIVKKNGAEPCFECHKPTYCSYCHVRLIH
jgi:nitrate/TMAO reductase-like tetraheme cytochrome c subunit